ncbi:CBP80/20-dependent translation initiation factor-like [Protopterus annectens]|uniref:CBP80/20-dependent translation initiation factor-like n=1 Tax=Protopterus annectens TaxID=7888 RepID=UPI001CFBF585|nr:CBP80/20-dependent translation initiation factor-like [Protopterus annectens]
MVDQVAVSRTLLEPTPFQYAIKDEKVLGEYAFNLPGLALPWNQQRTLGENKSKQQQQEQQPQCYQLQTEQQKNATRYCEDNPGNHHDKHDSTLLERESQNRQWNHSHGYLQSDKGLYETTGETETVKEERFPSENIAENHQKGVADLCCKPLILKSERKAINSIMDGAGDTVRCILLASSKDKVQQQPIEKENTAGEPTTSEMKNMEKMIEILNNMKNKSSNQDSKLITFMKEAQNLVKSEEMLSEVVQAIYRTAVTDRSFASTAARLCGKMAHFVVEGTKFRSLLLNMLQKDFSRRHELQHSNVEQWLGFITFLCEVFVTMRIKNGEPYHALVSPIYTCLRELFFKNALKNFDLKLMKYKKLQLEITYFKECVNEGIVPKGLRSWQYPTVLIENSLFQKDLLSLFNKHGLELLDIMIKHYQLAADILIKEITVLDEKVKGDLDFNRYKYEYDGCFSSINSYLVKLKSTKMTKLNRYREAYKTGISYPKPPVSQTGISDQRKEPVNRRDYQPGVQTDHNNGAHGSHQESQRNEHSEGGNNNQPSNRGSENDHQSRWNGAKFNQNFRKQA